MDLQAFVNKVTAGDVKRLQFYVCEAFVATRACGTRYAVFALASCSDTPDFPVILGLAIRELPLLGSDGRICRDIQVLSVTGKLPDKETAWYWVSSYHAGWIQTWLQNNHRELVAAGRRVERLFPTRRITVVVTSEVPIADASKGKTYADDSREPRLPAGTYKLERITNPFPGAHRICKEPWPEDPWLVLEDTPRGWPEPEWRALPGVTITEE